MRSNTHRPTGFVVAGLIAALLLAGFLSYYASAHPDGLTAVAQQLGFMDTEQQHARGDATFSGYTTEGVENERLSGGIAGVVGVAITFAAGGLLFWALRGRRRGATGRSGEAE